MLHSPVSRAWFEFAIWIGIAAFFFIFSFEFSNVEAGTFRWGAAFWPRLMIAIIVIAAIAHLLETLAKIKREEREAAGEAVSGTGFVWFESNPIQTLGIFALPLAYVTLLPGIGFYVLTPFFLVAELLLLGERSPVRIALTSAAIYALTCFVFAALFYVALPVGSWPGFYDVNTWIVEQLR